MTKPIKNGNDEDAGAPVDQDAEILARHADLLEFNNGNLIKEYLKLRNWKEAEEEAFEAHIKFHAKDRMNRIESIMLGRLNEEGNDRVASKGIGTAFKQKNASCRIVDPLAFRNYVIHTEEWDVADWKANKTAVRDMVERGEEAPPGVDYLVYPVVRFRKG